MGLVDYSDSESDSDTVSKTTPTTAAPAPSTTGSKKSFQKVVDRARPGKILVNLPQDSARDDSSSANNDADGPPSKRARIAGRAGSAFSGFNSILPAPKNAGKPAPTNSGGAKTVAKPGINLKTGAAPGFSREANEGDDGGQMNMSNDNYGTNLPAPKAQQPSIPAEQKPAEDVKLVGKPLMFKPLSVSRKPGKKSTAKSASAPTAPRASGTTVGTTTTTKTAEKVTREEKSRAAPPPEKKVSLFSIPTEEEPETTSTSHNGNTSGIYEHLFSADNASAFAAYDAQYASTPASASSIPNPPSSTSTSADPNSLDAIATSMNLSAAARRELFGRASASASTTTHSNTTVLSFDTSREYDHNEALRASGDDQAQAHNPVRAIAPGKHSLRQLVNQVHTQRDALEESFAKGRSTQREAGARYGWR